MSRIASRIAVIASLAFLLSASGAFAQPSPGPGPWSSGHPVWFDMNNDGTPQPTELMGYPEDDEGCTQVVNLPTGIPGTNQGYDDARAGAGVRALASPATGTGQLLDQNSDGIYDTLQVEGTGVPQTRMSLTLRDATSDGRPDYITVPWTTSGAGLLGVTTASTPRIYFPLTDTNADGWPDTITVQVVGGISTTAGPPLSGAALANGAAIPSASTLGLFAFAAAVVALGVKLLRGTAAA